MNLQRNTRQFKIKWTKREPMSVLEQFCRHAHECKVCNRPGLQKGSYLYDYLCRIGKALGAAAGIPTWKGHEEITDSY